MPVCTHWHLVLHSQTCTLIDVHTCSNVVFFHGMQMYVVSSCFTAMITLVYFLKLCVFYKLLIQGKGTAD